MRALATGAVTTVATFSALLFTPFLLWGGAAASSASPPSASGQAVAVVPGTGPWFVGGNVPPPSLPYVLPGGFRDSFLDPAGECTTWAAFLWPGREGRGVSWSGDAWEWLANAAAQGYATSDAPSVGAIAVWPRNYIPGNDATQWGHVAVVIDVGPGAFTVTEMNVVGQFRVDVRVVPLPSTAAGFIPLPADAFGGG